MEERSFQKTLGPTAFCIRARAGIFLLEVIDMIYDMIYLTAIG
jgi:hypothetical protein